MLLMGELSLAIGSRIRSYRKQKGYSQEKLSELANCHPTYIGQLERGEKNATLDSIEKITSALEVTLSELFYKLDETEGGSASYALQCYQLVCEKSPKEQEQLYRILKEITLLF